MSLPCGGRPWYLRIDPFRGPHPFTPTGDFDLKNHTPLSRKQFLHLNASTDIGHELTLNALQEGKVSTECTWIRKDSINTFLGPDSVIKNYWVRELKVGITLEHHQESTDPSQTPQAMRDQLAYTPGIDGPDDRKVRVWIFGKNKRVLRYVKTLIQDFTQVYPHTRTVHWIRASTMELFDYDSTYITDHLALNPAVPRSPSTLYAADDADDEADESDDESDDEFYDVFQVVSPTPLAATRKVEKCKTKIEEDVDRPIRTLSRKENSAKWAAGLAKIRREEEEAKIQIKREMEEEGILASVEAHERPSH